MADEALSLLKLTLNHELYNKHQKLLLDEFFPRPIDKLWQSIKLGHDKYKRDLNEHEVLELIKINNGTMTSAAKDAAQEILQRISELKPVGNDIAEDIIRRAYQHEVGRQLIENSYSLIEGKEFDLPGTKAIFEQIEGGYIPSIDNEEYVTLNVEELLEQFDSTPHWKFNLEGLQRAVGGIPPGSFSTIFARPEAGKSQLLIFFGCGPGGFLEQGAKVLYVYNEELAKRQMLRAVSCWTGLTSDQIKENPRKAGEDFRHISDNLRMLDAGGWTTSEIRSYCKKYNPDIIVIDQIDKLRDYPDQEGHVRLRNLYTEVREIGKDHNCAIIGVCQCSADGEGKSVLDYSMMENSKTGKASELDLCIGMGVNSIIEKADGNAHIRTLNLCKNKISGVHSSINIVSVPQISRFRD